MRLATSQSQNFPSLDGTARLPAASSLLTLRRQGSSLFLAGPSDILRRTRSSFEIGFEFFGRTLHRTCSPDLGSVPRAFLIPTEIRGANRINAGGFLCRLQGRPGPRLSALLALVLPSVPRAQQRATARADVKSTAHTTRIPRHLGIWAPQSYTRMSRSARDFSLA
ncbi:MAG: hypothetical protein RL385_5408 [Pseudomonadota bacterium]